MTTSQQTQPNEGRYTLYCPVTKRGSWIYPLSDGDALKELVAWAHEHMGAHTRPKPTLFKAYRGDGELTYDKKVGEYYLPPSEEFDL